MSRSANTSSNAVFTIVGKSDFSASPLQDGQANLDFLLPGQYRYYSLSVPNNTLDVVFDLTPFSGDADMFISCNKTLTGDDSGSPSRLHKTWSSQQWGEDTIFIRANDSASCVRTDPSGNGGTFFIAAYGFTNSTFSILASLDDGMVDVCVSVCTLLLLGSVHISLQSSWCCEMIGSCEC